MRIGIVQITDICNYHCLGCNPTNKRFANPETIINAILKNRIRIVSLTGGEPILHPEIEDIVSRLKKNYRVVHVASNGSRQAFCGKVRPHAISISLDSDIPEEHNRYRNNRSAFENAIRSIKLYKKNGIRTYANCLITPFNYNKIPQICRFVNSLGVRLGVCYPSDQGYLYSRDIASREQISIAFKSIINDRAGKYANCPSYYINAYRYSMGEQVNIKCTAGKDVFYIDMDGNLRACFLKDKYTRNCNDCFIECFREPNLMTLYDKCMLILR